ncbi:DUF881 domain-containing protein [Cellulomonas sp. URHD0024]|uniref:DUF881 domain-containing protein n=1 Tax=Cellulomonas sp. URHD0024 TaxID=1302620 RepID=UPI0012DF1778|nr:DUF881 domain-containing protein [Cellulomonas sp. URHD0024]
MDTPSDEREGRDDLEPGRPSPLEVFDALNEPRPDLAGPVVNDDESPLAAAAAAELARAEAIEQARADAIEESAHDAPDDAPDVEVAPSSEPGTDEPTGSDDEPTGFDDAPARSGEAPAWAEDASAGSEDESAVDGLEPAVDQDERSSGPEQPASPAAPASPGAWAVLGRALRPRMTRAQVLAGVLCAMLGFALVVQVRQAAGADLSSMRQQDLVRILDEVTNRSDALANESADLTRERDELLSGSDRRQAALDALRRSAETQGILTGRLPAEGPGVVVTLTEPNDSNGLVKPITMLDVLEELRNAGAEAIELNGQRVTASSAFTGTAGAIELDGVALVSPYVWTAIGDPETIDPALQIPGGAMAQVRNNRAEGTVDRRDNVQITALRVIPDPVYATPVPPSKK